MDVAADMNHLEVVKWLHVNRTEGCSKEAMGRALLQVTRGHSMTALTERQQAIEWLLVNRHEGCTGHALHFAIYAGDERHLDLVWALWSRSREDPEAVESVKSGFERACASVKNANYIRLLLRGLGDVADTYAGMVAASNAWNVAVIEALAPFVSPQVALSAGVDFDLGQVAHDAVVRIRENGESSLPGEALRRARRLRRGEAIRALVELGVDESAQS